MIAKLPITSADIPDEWIALVREIITREGRAVRGSTDGPTIEVKSLTTNLWKPLMLFSSATHFTNITERDLALARLIGNNV